MFIQAGYNLSQCTDYQHANMCQPRCSIQTDVSYFRASGWKIEHVCSHAVVKETHQVCLGKRQNSIESCSTYREKVTQEHPTKNRT